MKPVVITPVDSTESISDIMNRVIGDTHPDVIADLKVSTTPSFMKNGVIPADYIPAIMLRQYDKIYSLSEYAHWM